MRQRHHKCAKLWLLWLPPIVLVLASVITSCGDQETALPGDSIIINPSAIEIAYPLTGACPPAAGYSPFIRVDPNDVHADIQLITISVLDANGILRRGTEIEVTLSFTGSSSSDEIVWLFDDDIGNQDGSIQDPASPTLLQDAELVSTNLDATGYVTNTGQSGTKSLWILSDGNCPFVTNVTVHSGAVSALLEFEMNQ